MQSAFRRVRRKFRIYAGTLRFTISSCLNRPIVGPTPPKLPGLASNLRHHRVALLLTGAYIDYRIFAPMSRGKREIFIFRRIFLKKLFGYPFYSLFAYTISCPAGQREKENKFSFSLLKLSSFLAAVCRFQGKAARTCRHCRHTIGQISEFAIRLCKSFASRNVIAPHPGNVQPLPSLP